MKEVAGPLPPRATLFDPGKELGDAIDLVVVAAIGKGEGLCQTKILAHFLTTQ